MLDRSGVNCYFMNKKLLAVLFVAIGWQTAAAQQPNTRPNIVVIMPDDMGYTDISAFGAEIRTPNLDELAFSGVRLTNFHSGPTCGPTRAMFMSGMTSVEALNSGALKTNVRSLPELLRDAGYHTYVTGKWQNNPLGPIRRLENDAINRGFEKAYVRDAIVGVHFNAPANARFGGREMKENGEDILMRDLPSDFFSTAAFTDKAIEYIESNRADGRPWFTWLAYTAPHAPLQVPDDWLARYEGVYDVGYDVLERQRMARARELGVIPGNIEPDYVPPSRTVRWETLNDEEKAHSARTMEIYAAMMENLDFHVGRFVDYLKESGQFDNTVFIFMSDNGAEDWLEGFYTARMGLEFDNSLEKLGTAESFPAYGIGWAEAASAPFKWAKGTLTEGGVRVTAFVSHSSIARKGGLDDDYMTVMDILPTILELADVEGPGPDYLPVRGKSFWPRLTGDSGPTHGESEAIPYVTAQARALVRGEWKLIYDLLRQQEPTEDTKWELFNLVDDPQEMNDLSDEYPEIRQDLITVWEDFAEAVELNNNRPQDLSPVPPSDGGMAGNDG